MQQEKGPFFHTFISAKGCMFWPKSRGRPCGHPFSGPPPGLKRAKTGQFWTFWGVWKWPIFRSVLGPENRPKQACFEGPGTPQNWPVWAGFPGIFPNRTRKGVSAARTGQIAHFRKDCPFWRRGTRPAQGGQGSVAGGQPFSKIIFTCKNNF